MIEGVGPLRLRLVQGATEATLIAMACLSPWALASRGALAQFGLACGVLLLALLRSLAGWRVGDRRLLLNLPSLSLLGLVVLGWLQAAPCGETALKIVAPGAASLRASLIPAAPERVAGNSDAPVSLPPATISQYPEATLLTAARLAGLWVIFQSVLSLRPGMAPFRRFAAALVVNSFLLAFFALLQHLAWNGKIFWTYPAFDPGAGPFWNHNALAGALNLGLGILLGFLLGPREKIVYSHEKTARMLGVYMLAIIIVGVVSSLSRMGFASMVLTSLVASLVFSRSTRNAQNLALGLGGAVVVALVLILLAGNSIPLQQRLSSIVESKDYLGRLHLWRDAIRAWTRHPITGLGLGSFSASAVPFLQSSAEWNQIMVEGNARYIGTIYNHAENEYVEWLTEGGLVGLTLFLAFPWGVGRLTRETLRCALPPSDRALILGVLFSAFSLLVHNLTDFALHTPPVAIAVVILAAYLCKARFEAVPAPAFDPLGITRTPAPPPALAPVSVLFSIAGAVLLLGMGGVVVARLYQPARAELELIPVHLTEIDRIIDMVDVKWGRPGTSLPAKAEPRDAVLALDRALQHRPDWAEGHLLLATALIDLYEQQTAATLAETITNPRLRQFYASPLWFHRQYHTQPPEKRKPVEEILTFEPIADNLVPATLEYQEARRCCLVLAVPHVALASFDYLLIGGDSPQVYLERAYRLAGTESPALELIAQVAVQIGDLETGIKCWRTLLRSQPAQWARYADTAGILLPPDQVLDRVVTSGRYAVLFAERLYPEAQDAEVRKRFLEEALRRLPTEANLGESERLELEARARRGLGDSQKAVELLTDALRLEPRNVERRVVLVNWLLAERRFEDAHRQAQLGAQISPDSPLARQTLEQALQALVKSRTETDPSQ